MKPADSNLRRLRLEAGKAENLLQMARNSARAAKKHHKLARKALKDAKKVAKAARRGLEVALEKLAKLRKVRARKQPPKAQKPKVVRQRKPKAGPAQSALPAEPTAPPIPLQVSQQ